MFFVLSVIAFSAFIINYGIDTRLGFGNMHIGIQVEFFPL